ncbi:MAG: hypothetical protein ABI609_07785 [Acidobacteriota bacterium]
MRIVRLMLAGTLLCHTAAFAAGEGVDMMVKRLLGNKLQLQVPQSFSQLSEEKRMKFPKDRRPTVAFSDDAGAVSIAVTLSESKVFDSQIEDSHKNMIANLRSTFPLAQWQRNDRTAISNHPAFILSLRAPTTPSAPEARYVILGASLNGKLLTITMKCPPKEEEDWLPVWETVIKSVAFVP